MQVLAHRCANNVSAWAHRALADDRACELTASFNLIRAAFLTQSEPWMTALFLFKHPLARSTTFQNILMKYTPGQADVHNGLASIRLVLTIFETQSWTSCTKRG